MDDASISYLAEKLQQRIVGVLPHSPQRSKALQALDDCRFWAERAMLSRDDNGDPIIGVPV